jgi:hypothetical protein
VDAFEYYDVRDVVWLVTGIACFALGLGLLLGLTPIPWLLGAAAIAAIASLALVAMALISPPDYLEVSRELIEDAGGEQDPFPGTTFDLPFGRELGPWTALVASAGLAAGAVIARSGRGIPTTLTLTDRLMAVIAIVIGAAVAYLAAGLQWLTLPLLAVVAASAFALLRNRIATGAAADR